ncbi:MAG: ABC transporter ATP-binding protein/permease [Treponema sp.]|jgi:ATP-binding cassette subfamily B protein|nr:ABC transporter ATP-binding protein/permease [Treponema sp.]
MKSKRSPLLKAFSKALSKGVLSNYKTLIPYLYRYRFQYIAGFVCLLIVDAAQVIIPLFLQQAIDSIVAGGFTAGTIIKPAVAMVVMMTIVSGGRFLWRYFIHGSARRIETEMRAALFDHFLTLSYDFFQKNKIGDLLSRSTNDLDAVRVAIGMGLVALVDGTVMAVSILAIIFINDAHSAALAIIPLPLITALILLFGNLVGKRFQKAQEAYSAMSGTVQETFAGIRVVKSFVKEWHFMRKFADTNDDYRAANMALVKLYGIFFPLIGFFSGLTSIILLGAGGVRVIQGAMTPGQLTALFRYFQMLIWPLMGAGFMVNLIQRGAVSLGRINEVMHTHPLIASPAHPKQPGANVPNANVPLIEFRNLTFAYDGHEEQSVKKQNILENINLTIERGTWLGILGRTGSGKTSLVKALVRMIEPPANTVFVKGVDVRDWDLKELRRLVAVTPQDSYLFSDSIRQNIAYGLEDAQGGAETDAATEKIEKAVSLSAIDKDLANFADGLDTIIGERGLTLSGGQKQRVSISRAVIKDSEVLILDDALSAVDAETEQKILSQLLETRRKVDSARIGAQNGRQPTVIIISHRISTLCNADKALVLDEGRITEYGTPAELIAHNGFYAKTAALQQLERQDGMKQRLD